MIPYELIVTSASRPHLLKPTLTSLLARVDQPSQRIWIHDDAVFPGRWPETKRVVQEACAAYGDDQVTLTQAEPPLALGLALAWLLAQVQTEYVLYSQDDFVTVRDLPITRALRVMHQHGLHQIRFNKRATLAVKDTWQGPWQKEERYVYVEESAANLPPEVSERVAHAGFGNLHRARWRETLTVSDHWYFQLGLWRASEIRRALAHWTATPERQAQLVHGEPERLINQYFDRIAYTSDWMDPGVRAEDHRTFIWGPIGEDRYIRHIGGSPEDWAGQHGRDPGTDDPAKAWREIQSYPQS